MLYEYLWLVRGYALLNIVKEGAGLIEMYEINVFEMVFKLCIFKTSVSYV
jgi:hypothetical protein